MTPSYFFNKKWILWQWERVAQPEIIFMLLFLRQCDTDTRKYEDLSGKNLN